MKKARLQTLFITILLVTIVIFGTVFVTRSEAFQDLDLFKQSPDSFEQLFAEAQSLKNNPSFVSDPQNRPYLTTFQDRLFKATETHFQLNESPYWRSQPITVEQQNKYNELIISISFKKDDIIKYYNAISSNNDGYAFNILLNLMTVLTTQAAIINNKNRTLIPVSPLADLLYKTIVKVIRANGLIEFNDITNLGNTFISIGDGEGLNFINTILIFLIKLHSLKYSQATMVQPVQMAQPMMVDTSGQMVGQPMVVGQPMMVDTSGQMVGQPMVVDTSGQIAVQPMMVDSGRPMMRQPMMVDTSGQMVRQPMMVDTSGQIAGQPVMVDSGRPMMRQPMMVDTSGQITGQPVMVDSGRPMMRQPMMVDSGRPMMGQPMMVDSGRPMMGQPMAQNSVVQQPIDKNNPMMKDAYFRIASIDKEISSSAGAKMPRFKFDNLLSERKKAEYMLTKYMLPVPKLPGGHVGTRLRTGK